jgi:hypothetical protein
MILGRTVEDVQDSGHRSSPFGRSKSFGTIFIFRIQVLGTGAYTCTGGDFFVFCQETFVTLETNVWRAIKKNLAEQEETVRLVRTVFWKYQSRA